MKTTEKTKRFCAQMLPQPFGRSIVLLAALGLFAVSGVRATPRTLFDKADFSIGGFGGPGVLYSTFKGMDGVVIGGYGGVLLDKTIYLGAGGYGFARQLEGPQQRDEYYYRDPKLSMGYGGGLIGLVIRSDDVIHFSADVLVGGGAVVNTYESAVYIFASDHDPHRLDSDTDGFFVAQPMGHLVLNVTEWMRITGSAGYRFASNVNRFGLHNDDVSGPVAGITFRFGKF